MCSDVAAGTLLLEGSGRAECLLSAWKVAQTLIEWTSGVAGATLHRCGLSDTILLFPEHRAFGKGANALRGQVSELRQRNPERGIVVEVKTPEEAMTARDSGATVLQLEKFSPEEVARLAADLAATDGPQPVIAAAGGISAANAAAYAGAGARVLVTSWPYTARPADVQVRISAA